MGKSNKISVDKLADEVEMTMDDFLKFADGSLADAIEETAQSLEDDIRSTAPRRTGAYAASWTHGNRTIGRKGKQQTVVYANAPGYRLSHLLEHGHKIAGKAINVRAIEHIKPAADKSEKLLVQKIKEKLSS